MKRFLSFLMAILFAGSMMASVGNVYYTVTFKKATAPSSYAGTGDYAGGEITWTIPGNITTGDYIRIGGKSLSGEDRYIFSQSALGEKIAKIVISHNGKSRANVSLDRLTLTVASDAAFSENVEEVVYTPASGEIAKSTAGAIELTPQNEMWAANRYYKFTFTMSNSDSSNGGVDVQSIAFYSYQDASTKAINASDIHFGLVSTTQMPCEQTAELAVVGANLTEAISYSVIGDNVIATGSLSSAGGTLSVKLSANSEGAVSDTIVLTSGGVVTKVAVEADVIQTVGNGTKENPYSVADVVKLNNNLGNEKQWVIGYIVGCAATGGTIASSEVNTNIAIGDAVDQTENVVPVELSSSIRADLNIVDNPSNKGKQVKVYGQLISYFSFKGVKSVTEYELIESETPVDPTTKTIRLYPGVWEQDGAKYVAATMATMPELPENYTLSDILTILASADYSNVFEMDGESYVGTIPADAQAIMFGRFASDVTEVTTANIAILYAGGKIWNYSNIEAIDSKLVYSIDAYGASNSDPSRGHWGDPIADGYYLVGTFNEWTYSSDYLMSINPDNAAEYMYSLTLAENAEFKAAKVTGNAIEAYYPGTGYGNYIVDANHAGNKTVYFRPNGDGGSDWHEGTLYVPANPSDPTTCAEAREAALSVSKNNELYNNGKEYSIEGYVTSIKTAWTSSGYLSFFMADTQDGGDVIQAYRCQCANEEDAPTVGDKVKVTGKLTKYNGIAEFASGCTFEMMQISPLTGYFLLGTMNNWEANKAYLFVQNPNNTAEYQLTTSLAENDEFKVGYVGEDGNTTWYPSNNYIVNAAHAGANKTIYFRPDMAGGSDWYEGTIYVSENPKNLGQKTISEFLTMKNSVDTCVLTGVVSNIVNTTYGNFDLTDETGSVYVYGLLTADGVSKQFASLNVEEKDTLTVKAVYNEHNDAPQAKDAVFVEVKKFVENPVDPIEPTDEWDEIAFTEAVAVGDFGDTRIFASSQSTFSFTCYNNGGKMSLDASKAKFGTDEINKQYAYRLKTGGINSYMIFTIPQDGQFRIAVRPGNVTATDRHIVVEQGNETLLDRIVLEADTTANGIYPYYYVDVKAGELKVSYLTNGLNFYSFAFLAGEEPDAPSAALYVWDGIGSTESAIQEGGAAEAVQASGTNIVIGAVQKGNWCLKVNKGFSSGQNYVGIALDNGVNAGDTVKVAYFRTTASSSYVLGMDFSADKESVGTTYQILATGDPQVLSENGTPADSTYIVPEGVEDAKYIRLYRNSGSTGLWIAKVEVIKATATGEPEQPEVETKTIYLNTGGAELWGQNDPVFFAYSWKEEADATSMKMEVEEGDVYKAAIPSGHTSIIFVRMPAGSETLDWNTKWNQTGDLTISEDKNQYNITGWEESDGYWSVYGESVDPIAMKDLFFVPDVWASDGAIMAVWSWSTAEDGAWSLLEGDGDTLKAEIPETATKVKFVRFNSTVTGPYWPEEWEENVIWNQTDDEKIAGCGIFFVNGWNRYSWCNKADYPEVSGEWAEILFTEADVAEAGTLDGKVFKAASNEAFTLTVADAQGKVAIDYNTGRFGVAEENEDYTHRIKTIVKSKEGNTLTLNIPADGKLRIAARTGSKTATDRTLVLAQGENELYNEIVEEADSIIMGGRKYYPYITVEVKKGALDIGYPVNGLYFYSFAFLADPVQPVLANGYYLVGDFGGVASWDPAEERMFVENKEQAGEYMLSGVQLSVDDSLKVVYVENDDVKNYYGITPSESNPNGNYIVDGSHAGANKTVYFNPNHVTDWNGNIYVQMSEIPSTEAIILYVINKLGWQKIFAYLWDAIGPYVQWPGIELTKVNPAAAKGRVPAKYAEDDIYSFVCPKSYVNIIFTNGDAQTVDMTWTAEKPYFVLTDNKEGDKYSGHWQSDSATDIENVLEGVETVKVMMNGQMYILKGGKIYNVTGQLVR